VAKSAYVSIRQHTSAYVSFSGTPALQPPPPPPHGGGGEDASTRPEDADVC
jgi:hypothetical protein